MISGTYRLAKAPDMSGRIGATVPANKKRPGNRPTQSVLCLRVTVTSSSPLMRSRCSTATLAALARWTYRSVIDTSDFPISDCMPNGPASCSIVGDAWLLEPIR